SERHDARYDHRHGNCYRELPIELTRQAAEERNRDEHRAQHQNDGDDRAGHFFHGLDGGVARPLAFGRHDSFDVFQHHDRVVDHDADRQHQAEQGQEVYREAEHVHAGEGADDRNRNGDHRDDHRPHTLQEQKHHQYDQQDRLGESECYLLDRDFHETRGIERDVVA